MKGSKASQQIFFTTCHLPGGLHSPQEDWIHTSKATSYAQPCWCPAPKGQTVSDQCQQTATVRGQSRSRISGAGQHSFQLFPSKKQISASQVFHHINLLRPCQQECPGSSLLMWKNQHKQESNPVGFYSVFHRNITNHNHILGIYYMFQCFDISEQNKTPSCMLRYRTVKQASLPGILKYQYRNFFHEIYFFQRYIPENTFSKTAYAFNTRQSWFNFSKPH